MERAVGKDGRDERNDGRLDWRKNGRKGKSGREGRLER